MDCKLIRGGFSFCGVDIADLGLSYAPEMENTYVYRPADVNIHEETFDSHDGGYFYGTSKTPKEFNLRCYFENSIIDHGIMEKINNLFRPGKSGKLIFNRRPYCYYYATVTNLPHPELSNYMNGLITVTMKAYYPYARSDTLYYNPDINKNEAVKENDIVLQTTGLLENQNMVSALDMELSNITSSKSIILHNPGTEYTPVNIMISGDSGAGISIVNKTTNQKCKIVAMSKAKTSNIDKYIYIDGINGKTKLIGEGSSEMAFLYHEAGFISLAPAYPVIRNVFVGSNNGNIIQLINIMYDNVVGQYIFLNNKWCRITEQIDNHHLMINKTVTIHLPEKTIITHMNEIEIIPTDTMDIKHLSFSYKPNYA